MVGASATIAVDEETPNSITPAAPVVAAWWWPPKLVEQAASTVILLSMFGGVCVTLAGIVGRTTVGLTLVWEDQVGIVMLSILAFLGAAVGYRRRQFTALNWFDRRLSADGVRRVSSVRDAITCALTVVLTPIGVTFAISAYSNKDPYLHIPEFWIFLPVPIGTALIAIFALERLVNCRSWPIAGCVSVATLAGALAVLHFTVLSGGGPTSCVIAISVLALLLLLGGLPIPFVFGIGGLAYAYLSHNPLSFVASGLTDSTADFILVAIPFFLFTGFLMSEGELSDRLAKACSAVLARVPGGLLHVIIVSMFLFSGVSGSKIGDMAAVGKSAVRMAEQENYPKSEAMAAVCAGAAMGDTIPPSIGLIVLSSVSMLSVGALFAAGILPAVVTAGVLFLLVAVRYRNRRLSAGDRIRGVARLKLVAAATPFLIVPIIIIVGISGGIATPSEASAVAVVVSIVLLRGIYRNISTRQIFHIAVDASVVSGVVLFLIATASLFARALTLAEIPQKIASFAASGGFGGYWGFFIASSLVLVVMGMIMEGIPAMLVFAPILIPVATSLGINPLQYGIVIVMAIGIGANSPPIGIGLFVGAQIGQLPVERISQRMRPYSLTLYAGLIIVICAPAIVTWVPNVLHIS